MNNDDLGDRMKRYESVTRSVLLPRAITIIRVDGRAFHTYLRNAAKPYDFGVMADMQQVAEALLGEISGAQYAYGQSDEISIVIRDAQKSDPWFGGVIQKMASVAASCATGYLIGRRGWQEGTPQFDARVFQVPSWIEAANYTIWRQRDAVRNSISMAAQALFSTKQLHGKSCGQMQEMMFQEHGVNWNDYPESAKRGWVMTRQFSEQDVTYLDKRTNQQRTTKVLRTCFEVSSPHLTVESPLFALLRDETTATVEARIQESSCELPSVNGDCEDQT